MNKYQAKVQDILAELGITVNGAGPLALQVHDSRAYRRMLREPSLGLGESYMDAWWDCEALDEFFNTVLRGVDMTRLYNASMLFWAFIKYQFSNQQTRFLSRKVAEKHYNLGNDLYRPMLGETMAYTCGYWQGQDTLDAAQNAKYDLICRKLYLQPGERVLELGCGWGGFARYAAMHYGVEMTSVNIATEQMQYAAKICRDLPVHLKVCDYRDVQQYNPTGKRFDKVVSIGMCEHVGYKNYRTFLRIAHDNLKTDGLFLMHTIGKNQSLPFTDPWVQKYIFPQGILPTVQLIGKAAEPYFTVEDLHNFGSDYDKTLMAWYHNFKDSWPELKSTYGERFYRMWRYYLLSCAGAFRARQLQLWQYVFSPQGYGGQYDSIR